uniref:Si:ch211-258f14.2 n=1 Tax=Paramormyrops kingsleyae TaxID=1676925 RepID=A0A3B3S924_9TELE
MITLRNYLFLFLEYSYICGEDCFLYFLIFTLISLRYMSVFMARSDRGGLLCRRNSKLESFLKRSTERRFYERIRAYEPCIVILPKINKVFMYAVLNDESVYLAEFPPRTLQLAVCFRHVIDISLVNDLPDFLTGREREHSQHIRVVYTSAKHPGKGDAGHRGEIGKTGVSSVLPSMCSAPPGTAIWKHAPLSTRVEEEEQMLRPRPSPPLGHGSSPPSIPDSAETRTHWSRGSPDRRALILAKLTERTMVRAVVEKEDSARSELHLYAVSPSSRIYLHLQSAWNSYVIRSTLLLEPQFRKRCCASSTLQNRRQTSWERTTHLFGQLSRELLQQDLTMEMLYLLLQELHTAAHRNTAVRRLFWRSEDLCSFLVRTLEDTLQSCWKIVGGSRKIPTEDRLLLSALLAQTLGLMFRETEIEPTRLNLLTSKRGALTERLLLALVCDPGMNLQGPAADPGWNSQQAKLKSLLAEYLDAASALLFEVLLVAQQASHTSDYECFLTVGWVLKTLQSHQSVVSLYTLLWHLFSTSVLVFLIHCPLTFHCRYLLLVTWHSSWFWYLAGPF